MALREESLRKRILIWGVILPLVFAFNLILAQTPSSSPGKIPRKDDPWKKRGMTEIFSGTNRIDVFARGDDDTLQHRFFDGAWHDWESLGGILTSAPAAVGWGNGRMDVFVRGADQQLWQRTFQDGAWQNWVYVGGEIREEILAVTNGPNQIQVIARNPANILQVRFFDGVWHEWVSLGENISAAGSLASQIQQRYVASGIQQYSPRVWQTDQGLPNNTVTAILQTRDGYLWVGTLAGLARFDGVRFTLFNLQNMPAFHGSTISALCETQDGTLWIGTKDSGVHFFKAGVFSHFGKSEGFPVERVDVIYETKDGSLLLGTPQGLWRRNNERFESVVSLSPNFGTVRGICSDGRDGIWIATSRGLNHWPKGESAPQFFFWDRPSDMSLCVSLDHNTNLWMGSFIGLAHLYSDHFDWSQKDDGLPDNAVSALYTDRRGTLWIGTYGGLCRWTGSGFVEEPDEHGAAYDAINTITEDREGNIWLGTKAGLVQLKVKSCISYTRQEGLGHNNVMSVMEDRQNRIWMGTWGGNLCEFNGGHFIEHRLGGSVRDDLVLAVGQTRDGAIWTGGDFGGGLFRLQGKTIDRYQKYNGFCDYAVRVIYEDRNENLWIGTSEGLYRWKDKKFSCFTTTNGLAGNLIRALCEDREGHLWIGTSDGLTRRADETFSNFTVRVGLSHPNITALHADASDNLWIGTGGGGLNRLNISTGKFSHVTTQDGLASDSIYEILEDDNGWLWMSSMTGIFRVLKSDLLAANSRSPKKLRCVSYGTADGMPSAQCNGVAKPAGWKSHDGRLWFTTIKGVVVVDPKNERDEHPEIPVVIEELAYDKRVQSLESEVQSQNSRATAATLNFEPETLNLQPGRGELEFHYTALSFTVPEKIRFRYKLEGLDPDWVEADNRRSAFYNYVPPGNYTFRVIAGNKDGVWNAVGPSVTLTLQPHYWQTLWFKAAVILAGLSCAAVGARLVTKRRMQRHLEHLEQQHAIAKERSRIAQDMHDDLGVRLTEIALLSDLAASADKPAQDVQATAQKLSRTARDLVDSFDSIVWAVNPKNDYSDSFLCYLQEQVETLFAMSATRCRFDFPDEIPRHPMTSEMRHNLYLVIKESLHNVIKHSGAGEVWIKVRFKPAAMIVIIEDNGKGFSVQHVSPSGNGLSNMEKRMKNVGGLFSLHSEPTKGTRVLLQIPIGSHASIV